MTRRKSVLMVAVLLLIGSAPAQAADVVVIVNPSNPVKSLAVDELEKIFVKKTPKWDTGAAIQPVDQVVKSQARETFTKIVHGKTVEAVVYFWQQQIFSGKNIPPPEKLGDAAIVAFVRANSGAIGYVSTGIALDGVKSVAVLKPSQD